MSPITIGLIGHNGLVGAKILSELSALQQAGKVKLVVIHRPGSNVSNVPSDVEKRQLDWSKPDGPEYDQAVQGLTIVVSAIGTMALGEQESLLPALSRSQTLKTFFPSEYGTQWSPEELSVMSAKFLSIKDDLTAKAKKLGVATTVVHTGIFPDFIFNMPLMWNVKENGLYQYKDSQTNKIPFTSTAYVAALIADLVQKPIESIANKGFYIIEYEHSNEEIAEIVAKSTGKQPSLKKYDDAQMKAELAHENGFVSLGAGLIRKHGLNDWAFPGDQPAEVKGWKGKSLEQWLQTAIALPA